MSENNVIEWDGITSLDLPAERILRRALEAGLDKVVIVGRTEDGHEYFISSMADAADCAWHLQRGIWQLNTTIDRLLEE